MYCSFIATYSYLAFHRQLQWQSISTTTNICMYVFYDIQLEVLHLKVLCVSIDKHNFETMKHYSSNCCMCVSGVYGQIYKAMWQQATFQAVMCCSSKHCMNVRQLQNKAAASNFKTAMHCGCRSCLYVQLFVCVAVKHCSHNCCMYVCKFTSHKVLQQQSLCVSLAS